MTDYLHRNDHRLRELWMQIDQLHLSYLQADEDDPARREQRKKLESFIQEYLSLVPHDRKFSFRETAEVLHRSASTKADFTGYKAATAWNAIGTYAANLLSQPWRKEYREMKMYCGFYKHEVESNLVGAELMLEAMGYKHIGNTTMVLEGPIDPDRVSNVSRDSLMAAVECLLLKAIWEKVTSNFPCGWLEILEFRENHVGTADKAIQGIVYRFHQRQYQEHQQQQFAAYQAMENYGTAGRFHQPSGSCLYGQIPHMAPMGYYNYHPYSIPHPHAYTLPPQARYGTVLSPQQALPPSVPYPIPGPYHLPPVLKPQELYGATIHQYQAPPPPIPVSVQNGYTTAPAYPVPTGQLIELDAAPPPPSSGSETQQATDSSSSVLIPKTVRQHQSHVTKRQHEPQAKPPDNHHYETPRPEVQHPSPLTKAKDDGVGTFHSWDYVFRNLESQGYTKDLGERPDILSPPFENHTGQKKPTMESRPRQQQPEALELESKLMEMRLEEFNRKAMANSSSEHRPMKINEALRKIDLESNGEVVRSHPVGDVVDGNGSIYDNMSSPPKEVSSRQRPVTLSTTKTSTKTLPREPKKHAAENRRPAQTPNQYSSTTLDPRHLTDRTSLTKPKSNEKENLMDFLGPREEEGGKWQCVACTFLNSSAVEICEMCGKSKNKGSESRPLASGGRECPKCTLVNEKGVTDCVACGFSLKDSPTYI